MVLPSYYLPPISWFVRLLQSDEPVCVEQWANYRKQRLHNRCYIDSPNGMLALTIPVDKCNFVDGKCLMKDVMVSDHNDWQHQHWNALESSYFNSPFFEYLQDDFRPIYLKRWKWLMDLNETLVETCIEISGIREIGNKGNREIGNQGNSELVNQGIREIGRTTEFMGAQDPSLPPFKGGPGRVSRGSGRVSYYQVFAHKHGFLPDLSIIDLIFNMGPESIVYLYDLAKKTNKLNNKL